MGRNASLDLCSTFAPQITNCMRKSRFTRCRNFVGGKIQLFALHAWKINSEHLIQHIQQFGILPSDTFINFNMQSLFTSIPVPEICSIKHRLQEDSALQERTGLPTDQIYDLVCQFYIIQMARLVLPTKGGCSKRFSSLTHRTKPFHGRF